MVEGGVPTVDGVDGEPGAPQPGGDEPGEDGLVLGNQYTHAPTLHAPGFRERLPLPLVPPPSPLRLPLPPPSPPVKRR
ncbi:hypothetical protein GCM10010273_35180 [Streptomyces lavendulocolor]